MFTVYGCDASHCIAGSSNGRTTDSESVYLGSNPSPAVMGTILLFILSLVLMLVGLAGVILPFLPGVPLAYLGLFIYAAFTNFKSISLVVILVFLGLTIITAVLDFVIPSLGAKKYHASKWGIVGAFLGSLFGAVFFNLPGVIIGPFAGALIGELLAKKTLHQATQSAFGAFLGFLAGTLIKTVLILIMIGFLIVSLF